MSGRRVLIVATQGTGGNDERRIRELLSAFDPEIFPFHRQSKWESFRELRRRLRGGSYDLVVMEGSGLAGGLALLTSGVRYVLSSGDAFGPFLAARAPLAAPLWNWYERRMCRNAAGFIGWSPYLVGRALTFGAPRGCTAAGWAPFEWTEAELLEGRRQVRRALGLSESQIVYGIAGGLDWNARAGYSYGWELVEARKLVARDDVKVVIVGDGSGRPHLERLAAERLGRDVFLTGFVDRAKLPAYLAAFDVASLPQTLDAVGSFRYTTKLSEYGAAGLPVVCGKLPVAYDMDTGSYWRLPGETPWGQTYVRALAALMDRTNSQEIETRRQKVNRRPECFDKRSQIERVTSFVRDLLEN